MVPLPPISLSSSATATATGRSESGSVYDSYGGFSTGDFITGSGAGVAGILKAGTLPLTAFAVLGILWLLHKKK
jgi:hypothetical protein